MKFAIMGSGGVGGYFGGRLAAAGEDVHFVARGAHLAAMRTDGLRIDSPNGDLYLHPVQAADDPAAIGPVDYVLFAVKLMDTESAAMTCRPLVGPDTTVVALQNGVESEAVLGRVLGPDRVMGGTVYISAVIAEPGRVRQTGAFARLVFGEMDRRSSPRGERLAAACREAAIDATLAEDVEREIWMKFIVLVALSGVTTLTRLPVGALRADPDTRALFVSAIAEAAGVGRARGVDLPADAVERQMAVVDGWPAEMVASMLHDLKAGKPLELDWLSGAVRRLGREASVATPVHDLIWTALKLHAPGGKA